MRIRTLVLGATLAGLVLGPAAVQARDPGKGRPPGAPIDRGIRPAPSPAPEGEDPDPYKCEQCKKGCKNRARDRGDSPEEIEQIEADCIRDRCVEDFGFCADEA